MYRSIKDIKARARGGNRGRMTGRAARRRGDLPAIRLRTRQKKATHLYSLCRIGLELGRNLASSRQRALDRLLATPSPDGRVLRDLKHLLDYKRVYTQ